MTTTQKLPHWDMRSVYPGLDSPEFTQGFAAVVHDIDELALVFDTLQIQKASERAIIPISDALITNFETVIQRYNAVLDTAKTLVVYINCFVSTNSHNALAQAKLSELKKSQVLLFQLGTRLAAWLGSLDRGALLERSALARDHAYALHTAQIKASHLMSPLEEALAAELNVNVGSAWARLHNDLTSQLSIALEVDGKVQSFPMSIIRNMAYNADRDLRRRAFEAELAGWQQAALPLAAAFNGLKGEVTTLARHRGWDSPLATSLFTNSIDRETFDAMLNAARSSFPDFRRYLHAKAHTLNLPRLAWYDLFAPLSTEDRIWQFDAAATFIIEQFGSYSSRMAAFAARAFSEQWIDAEPRAGKRDGAYCTSLCGEESRVFTNFKPAFAGVSTLAHELGHAYHNLNLAHCTPLQRTLPMTLAETASIFCETIIRHAALRNADKQERITILEASIQGSCQVVVDVVSRLLFEQRAFAMREQRELSIDELNTLMLDAQRETYGDGLDQSLLHPYMWAVKPHYYIPSLSFYNYPYMFGLLFGLGLYARYQQDPDTFKQNYDDLLSSTGLADAATLAARFAIDLRSEAFWRASLSIIRQDIDLFVELTQAGPEPL